jgi:hypothetical protein
MAKPAKKTNPAPASTAGPTAVPSKETREEKLLKLANKRVPKALNAIRLIGNLAAYKPTEADVTAIEQALGEAVADVLNRLQGGVKVSTAFTLRTHPPQHG